MIRAGLASVFALALAARAALALDGGSAQPPSKASDRLPENPALGAHATAQWRTFMANEERERRLHFDRRRLKQHRRVMQLLKQAQARYDRARTGAAIEAARARVDMTAADVRARVTAIDHWGNNSNVLADYQAILKVLADEYPAARLAALGGDARALARLRAELADRDKKISNWLAEAATSKDE